MSSTKETTSTYTKFACIGAGFSGIALGATLKRWYGITDIRFFERHGDLGGTWFANKYPGAACDVPSALYSFSFEPNPNWSRFLPPQQELWEYQKQVAVKYGLLSKMSFGVEVQSCQWVEEKKRWTVEIRDCKTGNVFYHECRFLFAGSGILVTPRQIDIPGSENFRGSIFHSSRWRADVDVEGKNVVVIGNGCTAAQIVPSIVDKAKNLTQIIRSKHWILPPIDMVYAESMRKIFRYLPVLMMIQRLLIFLIAEVELRAVPMTISAAKFRQKRRAQAEQYMRAIAPAKYHGLLIPDFEIGCKRRIYDSGYLKSLHSKNMTLTNERALKIVEHGIETDRGFIEADVIVLANGFSTNTFLEGVTVTGREGTLNQHWKLFGGAEAYNCSAMSGFPNFFMLLGPNATTGHTSAIMAIENSVNFALRILKPVLDSPDGVVELDKEAERRYVDCIQDDLSKTVWSSGCQSWYTQYNSQNSRQWNAMIYPYSQAYLWYRSLFPIWRDWKITDSAPSGLFLNPSFDDLNGNGEYDGSPWVLQDSVSPMSVRIESGLAHTGSHSAYWTITNTLEDGRIFQQVSLDQSQFYQMSYWWYIDEHQQPLGLSTCYIMVEQKGVDGLTSLYPDFLFFPSSLPLKPGPSENFNSIQSTLHLQT